MDPVKHLKFSLLTLFTVIAAGTTGYTRIEDWTVFDSLFITVITLATVGFKEVHQLSPEGKLFTIVLIVCGTGIIAYALGSLIQFMVEGQLNKILGRRKLESRLSKLEDHYIVCGYGRIGHMIFNPSPASAIDAGAVLITLGERSAINHLEQVASGGQAVGS